MRIITWTGLDNAICKQQANNCSNVDFSGTYYTETDSQGQSKLQIQSEIKWKDQRRNLNMPFAYWFTIATGDDETEWVVNSWKAASWHY